MAVICNTTTVVAVALLSVVLPIIVSAKEKFSPRDGRRILVEGSRVANDVLLFHDNPAIEGTLFPYPKVQSYDVCYPRNDSSEHVEITFFSVLDQGEDGYAFKRKESTRNRLCLHLKTRRGSGYNFDIDIWGFRKRL